ncbi:hypothetical protein GC175_04675 [bacterium]|nr:hypothetical protein [bacterium]
MRFVFHFLLMSVVIWLVPFVASIPFFDRTGALIINFWAFKALMTALLIATCFVAFRRLYRRTGMDKPVWTFHLLIGLGALTISVILDAVTVIPLTGIPPLDYIQQVVSIYLLIPLISIYVGNKQDQNKQAQLEAIV